MSKMNATTKRKKVARTQHRGRTPLQRIARIDWLLDPDSWGGERIVDRFERIEAMFDCVIKAQSESSAMMMQMIDLRMRLHELQGHGELVSMPAVETQALQTATARPQLQLLAGGLHEPAPRESSARKPTLRLLPCGSDSGDVVT